MTYKSLNSRQEYHNYIAAGDDIFIVNTEPVSILLVGTHGTRHSQYVWPYIFLIENGKHTPDQCMFDTLSDQISMDQVTAMYINGIMQLAESPIKY